MSAMSTPLMESLTEIVDRLLEAGDHWCSQCEGPLDEHGGCAHCQCACGNDKDGDAEFCRDCQRDEDAMDARAEFVALHRRAYGVQARHQEDV